MSTPGTAVVSYSPGSAPAERPIVEPSAVSSPKSNAVFQLGEVLKTVLHKTLAFSNENDLDAAVNTVDSFVKTFIPVAEMPAIFMEGARAIKEDVTQRIPPGGAMANVVSGPVLDYSKLAQAILAEQRKYQATIEGDKTSE
jgi:anionic cell wall polymer biosynthesis LytR-Cps2A-Psr (LCP) family protein